jgi:hypothetical protein
LKNVRAIVAQHEADGSEDVEFWRRVSEAVPVLLRAPGSPEDAAVNRPADLIA